jgi:uncharacterized protein with HEPN domain
VRPGTHIRKFRGCRSSAWNRLIHAYFDVDLQVVWDTVTIDLPQLVTVLEPLVRNS